ncbi:hypothetical protein RRG08_045580 [Elysia crispata]|uniref:Uncharacterized protein n=1 Tax=Elysia crispata TaxID=231223 RepID=A0AAE1DWJ3_9GAST|nr:hypothetical protein RRG08_045580 [Elysia crispata]
MGDMTSPISPEFDRSLKLRGQRPITILLVNSILWLSLCRPWCPGYRADRYQQRAIIKAISESDRREEIDQVVAMKPINQWNFAVKRLLNIPVWFLIASCGAELRVAGCWTWTKASKSPVCPSCLAVTHSQVNTR